MYKLQLLYEESGKRYTFSFDELVEKLLTKEQIANIKTKVIKEIQKR